MGCLDKLICCFNSFYMLFGHSVYMAVWKQVFAAPTCSFFKSNYIFVCCFLAAITAFICCSNTVFYSNHVFFAAITCLYAVFFTAIGN
jgi:hypothetical protein